MERSTTANLESWLCERADRRRRRCRARPPARSRSTCWSAASSALPVLVVLLALPGCLGTPAAPPVLDDDQVQRGALLFHDPRLSGDGSRSCATCHPGGASDGRIWAGTREVAAGDPRGRRTLPLRGLWQTPPYLWDGSLGSVREVLERMLAIELGGAPLSEPDMAALEAYVLSIPAFDNGRVQPDGSPSEPATLSARRGFELFRRAGCDVCHRPPSYSHGLRFEIGTDGKWSVPSLRNVSRQPSLGHDGRWPDLETAVIAILLQREVTLTNPELHQLLRYLELL